jgi:hypothetical protein
MLNMSQIPFLTVGVRFRRWRAANADDARRSCTEPRL